MKKQLCVLALLTTAAMPAVHADDFTYLSGGLLFNKQGTLANVDEYAKARDSSYPNSKSGQFKQQTNSVGFYLNGSVGFDNQVFVEGRVHHSRLLRENLLGVGYHYPIMQQVDVYGLLGVSQRSVVYVGHTVEKKLINDNNTITLQYKTFPQLTHNYSDNLRPTVELGLKARFNEVAGVRVAYRFAQFGDASAVKVMFNNTEPYKDFKVSKSLHEFHGGGYYKISDNLAAEAGYTYTVSFKGAIIKDKASKDHAGTIGLRYTF